MFVYLIVSPSIAILFLYSTDLKPDPVKLIQQVWFSGYCQSEGGISSPESTIKQEGGNFKGQIDG